jgi:hypothetical protein
MSTEPSVLRHYGIGASLIGPKDPTGTFLLELLIAPTVPPSALSPTLLPQFHHNQTDNCIGDQRTKTNYSY